MQRTHSHVARCNAKTAGRIAVAPCYSQFQLGATPELDEIQVMPAGEFRARDGRPEGIAAWRIDAQIAARVIARFKRNQTPLVIDYEHQTLEAKKNGQPAPAAGRFRDLIWREAAGLFAAVTLTPRARQYIQDEEYLYFSPVFAYDGDTGEVLEVLMGALTNDPALDGMAQVELRAAARYAFDYEEEETTMKNKLLLAVCAALAIKVEGEEPALETQAIAALTALKEKPDPLTSVRTELGLADTVAAEEVVAACKTLKTKAAASAAPANGNPDPTKYVGVEVVEELKTQVAALTATNTDRAIDDLVKPALVDGRLLAAQETWARDLGKQSIASLTAYLKTATPIAALNSTQTGGRQPVVANAHGLNADELAVCTATGVDPAEYAKTKTSAA